MIWFDDVSSYSKIFFLFMLVLEAYYKLLY